MIMKREVNKIMYPVFARVKYLGIENETKTDDIWFFASDYSDAAGRIEKYFEGDLLGFSIYMFDTNDFLFQSDLFNMEMEAKRTLGIC